MMHDFTDKTIFTNAEGWNKLRCLLHAEFPSAETQNWRYSFTCHPQLEGTFV